MPGRVAEGVSRLLARSRRPAVDPWARLPAIALVEGALSPADPPSPTGDDDHGARRERIDVAEPGPLGRPDEVTSPRAFEPASAAAVPTRREEPEPPQAVRAHDGAVTEPEPASLPVPSGGPPVDLDPDVPPVRLQAGELQANAPARPAAHRPALRAEEPLAGWLREEPEGDEPRPPASPLEVRAPAVPGHRGRLPQTVLPPEPGAAPAPLDRPPAPRAPLDRPPAPPALELPAEPTSGGGAREARGAPREPTVVIDEIRIVTPPPPTPPGDPLASLAARRVGASRHRGGPRWPA